MKAFVRRYHALSFYTHVHDCEVDDIIVPEKNIVFSILEDGSGIIAFRSDDSFVHDVKIIKEIDIPMQLIDDAEAYIDARDALQVHQQFIQQQMYIN